MQALVYDKKYDNFIRSSCRHGGSAEAVLESETIAQELKKIQDTLANEEAERKVAAGIVEDSEPEDAELADSAELLNMRKAPTTFTQGSNAYWRAVANQVTRTYCSIQVEPKSLDGVASAVQQSTAKDIRGVVGENSVLIHLDVDLLGETIGPNCQESLRKKFQPDIGLMRKLVQGALLGRGAQRRTEEGEATNVPEGDVVALHAGMDRAGAMCQSVFRLATAKKDDMDAEIKQLLVTYDDDSMRSRKKRSRGSYSTYSTYYLASHHCLTQAIPEKQYQHHKGYCTSDVFGPVKAMQASELWHASRTLNSISDSLCIIVLYIFIMYK